MKPPRVLSSMALVSQCLDWSLLNTHFHFVQSSLPYERSIPRSGCHVTTNTSSWSFLAHWLPALAHRPTRVVFRGSVPDHAFKSFSGALEITPVMTHDEPTYLQRWQEQCEGMELLAMLTRVDQPAAMEVIKMITLVDHSEMDWRGTPIEYDLALKYHIKIHQDDVISRRHDPQPFFAMHVYQGAIKSKEADELLAEDAWPGELVKQLFKPFVLSERSPQYQEAREELIRRAQSAQTRTFIEELKIPVVLDIQLSLEQLLTPCITAFVEAKSNDSLFALESVHYGFSDKDVWSDWVEEWCQAKKDEGISVAALGLSGGDAERPYLLPLLRRHVEYLKSPFLGEVPSRSFPTSNLEVTLNAPLGCNSTAGVFSLLAGQVSIETLRLRNLFSPLPSEEDEDEPEAYADRRKRDWRWFGFLFFSPYSSASFTTLDFDDVKLTMADIEAINVVRNAENPFSWLRPRIGDETPREQPLQIAQVEAGTLIEPTTEVEYPCDDEEEGYDEDLSCLFVSWIESNRGVLAQPSLLRVVDDEPNKPTVDVLFPGFGVCPINRTNAKISLNSSLSKPADDNMSTGSYVPSLPAQALDHLRISLDPDDEEEMEGLVPFVKLFGECLVTLSIRSKFWPMIDDANVHSIVRACPILEELALDGVMLSSLEVIIDLFEVDKCEVNSLKLNNLCVAQTGDKTRLMTVIANPNSAFSSSLRRLTLDFSELQVETIAVIMAMLQVNRTLQFVDIGVPPAFLSEVESMMEPHHNEIIQGIKSYLSPSSRWAFLSVMHHANALSERSVLSRMDSMVIARIFEYANEPMCRVVCLRESKREFGAR